MHTCLSRSYSPDSYVFVHVQDSHCCEVNVFKLVSLKKTWVSDVFGKSCGLLMYMGKEKNVLLKGSIYNAWMSNELSEDWLRSASLQAIWIWIVQFFIVYSCFAGTFLDLTAGILKYNCQFCAWYFECCEVRIPGLSFWVWFKIIWKYLLWHYFVSVIWQLTVQAVVLVMLSGYRDRLSQKDWWW